MRRPSREPQPEEGPSLNLTAAERRRRRREAWIALGIAAALLGLPAGVDWARDRLDSGLFLFLNAFTVILILVLGFLVTRNFWKLVGERRRGILGSRLNLKFVAAFVLIALVTTSGFFVVSALFVTQSIDTWFSVQVDRALEESGEVVESYYESTARSAEFFARGIAETITEEKLLREDRLGELEGFVGRRQRDFNLGVVEVFSATGEELVSAINPDIPAANFSRQESDLVQSAMQGGGSWRVREVGGGDVIRAAVPIASSFRPEEAVGVVVVNVLIPFSQARKVAGIRATLDEYRALQPAAGQIRSAYLLELLLAFALVLMLALWMGFRLAKGVTGPIGALAEGTVEVARGNLDVRVKVSSDDEVGLLVDSFNRMLADLRAARSDLERSATQLERRRRYMEIVLGNVGAGVVSLDAEGLIRTINPSAQRHLGVAGDSRVVGRSLADVATDREIVEALGQLVAAAPRGAGESVQRQLQVAEGDEAKSFFVTLTAMQDASGDSLGWVVVFDDYSQLMKLQRMSAWREVARRIAHEIKNPLTPIQLSTQRMRRRFRDRLVEDPRELRIFDECMDAITSHVEGLKVLVNEFSNFARLPTANLRPDDLNRIIRELLGSYVDTPGVSLRAELDDSLPLVEVDREQMRRALANLLDNAISATREREAASGGTGGEVVLRSAWDPGLESARIEVADNGTGIPLQDQRRIFEPYYSTKESGTGLGLAIVSRIVADHHGYLRVHANRPRGARMVVELPLSISESAPAPGFSLSAGPGSA